MTEQPSVEVTEAVIARAQAHMKRADEEYEQLAAPDGMVSIEMNLLRALITLAMHKQQVADALQSLQHRLGVAEEALERVEAYRLSGMTTDAQTIARTALKTIRGEGYDEK